jgi:hypothetical protein
MAGVSAERYFLYIDAPLSGVIEGPTGELFQRAPEGLFCSVSKSCQEVSFCIFKDTFLFHLLCKYFL